MRLAFALAFLLAGCAAPLSPLASPPTAESECFPPAQEIEAQVRGYAYWIPNGGGGGGTTVELVWSGNPEDLLRFTVKGEWDALSPLTEQIRIEAWLYYDYGAHEQPWIEGPSPLEGTFKIRDLKLDERPVLALGPPTNWGIPVFASATVVDQPIHLTIQEVYRC